MNSRSQLLIKCILLVVAAALLLQSYSSSSNRVILIISSTLLLLLVCFDTALWYVREKLPKYQVAIFARCRRTICVLVCLLLVALSLMLILQPGYTHFDSFIVGFLVIAFVYDELVLSRQKPRDCGLRKGDAGP